MLYVRSIALALLLVSSPAWGLPKTCSDVMRWMLFEHPQFKARISKGVEKVADILQDRRPLTGRTTTLGGPGARVTLQVDAKIGAGALGIVYHTHIVDFEAGAARAFPKLFNVGKARQDLVIKVPRHLAWGLLEPVNGIFAKRLQDERRDTSRIQDMLAQLGRPPIRGAEILAASNGSRELNGLASLIKPLLPPCCGVADLARQGEHLTAEQKEKLWVVFESAIALREHAGISLDLKPYNVMWDPQTREWQMYELTDMPDLGFQYTPSGFAKYVELFEESMKIERDLQTTLRNHRSKETRP